MSDAPQEEEVKVTPEPAEAAVAAPQEQVDPAGQTVVAGSGAPVQPIPTVPGTVEGENQTPPGVSPGGLFGGTIQQDVPKVEEVADDVAAVATEAEDVAKVAPVPGASEVATAAGDVAEVAGDVAQHAAADAAEGESILERAEEEFHQAEEKIDELLHPHEEQAPAAHNEEAPPA